MSGADEFGEIERLFRPLTGGAEGALDLKDDAAILPSRPGFEVVVTKDAVVEGVHFPDGERPGLVAQKVLRVNLSDLAAKAAEPFACFLAVGWPRGFDAAARTDFAAGLGEDLRQFGVALMGGDTVVTPGPFWASLTALGWAPKGRMVRRAGARVGDVLWVSGVIGDGALGLAGVRGELADPHGYLAGRYRLPAPRLELRDLLLGNATAAADVSDGLIADAAHIASASGVGLEIDLERVPLSEPAQAWLQTQPDRAAAVVRLVTGGDDYEIVCTAPQGRAMRELTAIGRVVEGAGVKAMLDGRSLGINAAGWRHL